MTNEPPPEPPPPNPPPSEPGLAPPPPPREPIPRTADPVEARSAPPEDDARDEAARSRPRRLHLSRRDRVIGGVSGGLAEYLGVDAVLIRIVMVLLAVFSGGVFILFYIVAWIVMPEDDAPAMTVEGTYVRERRGSSPVGGAVLGVLLVAAGAIWLLSLADIDIPNWDAVLSVALIGVGLGLVLTAGRRGVGLLITLGVLLTLVLTSVTAVDVTSRSAFGQRVERPLSLGALQSDYSHAFGQLTLDLRSVRPPAGETAKLDVNVAFGEVVIRLPRDVGVEVQTNVFFGNAEVLNEEASGLAGDRSVASANFDEASSHIEIDLSIAFGSAVVTQ